MLAEPRLRGQAAGAATTASTAAGAGLDAGTGAFVARGKAGGRVTNAPRVADGILVVQDDEGRVSAFRPRAPKPAKTE